MYICMRATTYDDYICMRATMYDDYICMRATTYDDYICMRATTYDDYSQTENDKETYKYIPCTPTYTYTPVASLLVYT